MAGTAYGIDYNGFVGLDGRYYSDPYQDFMWDSTTLGMKATAPISENFSAYSEVWLRSTGFPGRLPTPEAMRENLVYPTFLDIREAYLDVYGFMWDNVDLRIGKQRIAWGKADRLNPTDNLNPYDFSDLFLMGEKTPSNALKVSAYLGERIVA